MEEEKNKYVILTVRNEWKNKIPNITVMKGGEWNISSYKSYSSSNAVFYIFINFSYSLICVYERAERR